MTNRINLFAFLMILFVLSCTKPPDYPDEPVIELVSMSKFSMAQNAFSLADSILITISFTDGDGDLGMKDSLPHKITYLDTRVEDHTPSQINTIAIPYIPEQGAGNGISGTMDFSVYTECCRVQSANGLIIDCEPQQGILTDTFSYEIFLTDQAGNESNHIFTDPIVLICQ